MMTIETTSLILSALLASDVQTARQLAATLGTTPRALRPALRQLVESEVVVTSGYGRDHVYLLAAEPVEQPVAVEPSAVLRLAREVAIAAAVARKPRTARPVIPATLDIESALVATQQRLEAGATLAELSARPVPQSAPARIVIAELAAEVDALVPAAASVAHRDVRPENVLHRECVTPIEDVAARKLALQQQEAAGEAHDRATDRRERRTHAVMGLASALMVLAPVAWVVAHLMH